MKRGVLVVALALLVTPTGRAAAPAGFYEARVLEPAASFVAGKPATVWCASSDTSWAEYTQPLYGSANINGTTYPGSSESRLSPVICSTLKARLAGRKVDAYKFAASVLTLTHESVHQRGTADEGQTECDAMHRVPGVAVRFFRVRAGAQLRALMTQAWRYHRTKPPVFQAVC